jgi:hypothetical protein
MNFGLAWCIFDKFFSKSLTKISVLSKISLITLSCNRPIEVVSYDLYQDAKKSNPQPNPHEAPEILTLRPKQTQNLTTTKEVKEKKNSPISPPEGGRRFSYF